MSMILLLTLGAVQTRWFFKNPRQLVEHRFGQRVKFWNPTTSSPGPVDSLHSCDERRIKFSDLQVKFQSIIDTGKDDHGVMAVFP